MTEEASKTGASGANAIVPNAFAEELNRASGTDTPREYCPANDHPEGVRFYLRRRAGLDLTFLYVGASHDPGSPGFDDAAYAYSTRIGAEPPQVWPSFVPSAGVLIAALESNAAEWKCYTIATRKGEAVEPPVSPRYDWRIREAVRFLAKRYTPVLMPPELVPIYDHFLHVSKTDGLWAFTETPEKGAHDIQTPIRPGRYLQRYYPHLRPEDISRLVALMTSATDPDVRFAVTPDDIVRVYRDGPWSCMHYAASRFDTWDRIASRNLHPVEVYGSLPGSSDPADKADLALAYWEEPDPRDGYAPHVTARALVWPEKKLYGRVYAGTKDREADDNNATLGTNSTPTADRFKRALRALGYSSPDGWNSLAGARIRRIELPNGGLLVPYIDAEGDDSHRFGVSADGKHLMLDPEGPHEQTDTCGVWDADGADGEEEYPYTCECCENECCENETTTVWTSASDSGEWCDDCREADASRCPRSGRWYADSAGVEVVTAIHDAGTTAMHCVRQVWSPRSVDRFAYLCAGLDETVADTIARVDVLEAHVYVSSQDGVVVLGVGVSSVWAKAIADGECANPDGQIIVHDDRYYADVHALVAYDVLDAYVRANWPQEGAAKQPEAAPSRPEVYAEAVL